MEGPVEYGSSFHAAYFEFTCPELGNKIGNVNCYVRSHHAGAFSPVTIANKTGFCVSAMWNI
jgi:hypothetical protein